MYKAQSQKSVLVLLSFYIIKSFNTVIFNFHSCIHFVQNHTFLV